MVRCGADAVVGRHQQQHECRLGAPLRRRRPAEQADDERRQQVDIDNRHPVDGEPVPVERAQQARAVDRRQIHQHVQHDARSSRRRPACANDASADGPPDCRRRRTRAVTAAANCPAPRPSRPTACRRDAVRSRRDRSDHAEADQAERAVRRAAMPFEILHGAAGGRDDVDVGRVRGEDQRRRGAAAGARQRRARERHREQRMSQIVQVRSKPVANRRSNAEMELCHPLLIYQHAKRVHRRDGRRSSPCSRRRPRRRGAPTAHRYIMGRAIDLLPAELKPFFEHYRDEVVMRVGRSRRVAQRRLGRRSESLRRFRDEGARRVSVRRRCRASTAPRSQKFGQATLNRIGKLPWREEEEFGNLRRGVRRLHARRAVRAERPVAVRGRRRRTTFRTRISRFTARTTTTASSPATTASTRASSAICSSASSRG